MKGIRQARIPFDHFVSEIAAAPFAWEEMAYFAPTHIDPSMGLGGETRGRLRITSSSPRTSSRAQVPTAGEPLGGVLWRQIELKLLAQFPSFSVDEVIAFRDALWFGDGAVVKTRPLWDYLRSLSQRLLHIDGPVARPRTPLWRIHPEARRSEARVAAQWTGFAMPMDLLIAAHPGSRRNIPEPSFLAEPLEQAFRDHGFAELHCHLGNAVSFDLLWLWAQRAVLDPPDGSPLELFHQPGTPFDHGRGLAGWILAAMVARWMLARFLAMRGASGDGDFAAHLKRDPVTAIDARDADLKDHPVMAVDASWAHVLRLSLARLAAPVPDEPFLLRSEEHRRLAAIYHHLSAAGQPPNGQDNSIAADPVFRLLPGATGNADQRLVRDGLLYLAQLREKGDTQNFGGDELFERLLWQVIRVRNVFYRTIVQRPMTAGLMWFVRTNARSQKLRKQVAFAEIVGAAARTCGAERGLRSLEIRVPPPHDHSMARDWHRAVQKAWRTKGACRSKALEIGLVVHFSRDRGGSWRDAQPTARGWHSDADPSLRINAGARYRQYAQTRRNEARTLASVLRQRPALLGTFRGLDVCSDELGIPVWVLAPLIRGVRRASERAAVDARTHGLALEPLRVTAHAGEDFVHLLGGLRRVHETLNYLSVREGDRIGHALALGLEPAEWAREAGTCAVSIEERLLDLVWAWERVAHDRLAVPGDSARKMEHEIATLSSDLFGSQITPFTLAKMVEDLFSDETARELWESSESLVSSADNKDPDCSHCRWMRDPVALRRLWMTDPVLFERGRKIIFVDPEPEVALLEALQLAVRREVGARGVAIEVNPSSNLLIGNLSDLRQHPLWRLAPPIERPDLPPIDVVVGSDNPLMLATDTQQEYQRLYDAMRLSDISEGAAWSWITRARETSLRYRFTRPDPPQDHDTLTVTTYGDPLEGWESSIAQR
ncbi:MAG: hypothetical protein R3B70_27090 [Polyangiaceae bacterium]